MENTTLDNIVSIEAFQQLDKMRNTAEHVSQSFAAKEEIPLKKYKKKLDRQEKELENLNLDINFDESHTYSTAYLLRLYYNAYILSKVVKSDAIISKLKDIMRCLDSYVQNEISDIKNQ